MSERTYPTFGPADDDFHDAVMSDRWWETETCWFSWNVPERNLGGWTYCQARPNARLCNGGVWVWDDTGSHSWDLPYHVSYSGLRLPDRAERDMRDFEWPNGVHVKTLEPLTRYEIAYDDPGALTLHLEFEALIPPNPHPVGVAPFIVGTHFDQPGHVTGEMVLHGEHIPIDCYSVRDRSWGPRPAGRPKRRRIENAEIHTGAGGIGYSFGVAGPRDAWLTYSIPQVDRDPVVCGFLLRDGEYGHVLSGARNVRVDATTGWPTCIDIDAVDDLGRRLDVHGDALSRHWKGHGGDTLMRWTWDDRTGFGEDQSYFSRAVWNAQKERAPV
ncbi:MAG: hypothetical protein AMXMBFR46_20520 [Acidimicrobiia bacterium]